ncbi:hypothetical protein [Brevibacillus brevis]|uniref:hypothetical protein n=1 Tax=Brevibacillus brevis TaxID=1393 RepID=UPI0025A53DA1|nr:hypothetical protein [Brevibacillus brevis]WJQ80160.1 hypothetical protein QN310_22225 [Brevibacillus brevis]
MTYTTSFVENIEGVFQWENKVDADVVMDGQFITAVGGAYVEFAVLVLQALKLEDEYS